MKKLHYILKLILLMNFYILPTITFAVDYHRIYNQFYDAYYDPYRTASVEIVNDTMSKCFGHFTYVNAKDEPGKAIPFQRNQEIKPGESMTAFMYPPSGYSFNELVQAQVGKYNDQGDCVFDDANHDMIEVPVHIRSVTGHNHCNANVPDNILYNTNSDESAGRIIRSQGDTQGNDCPGSGRSGENISYTVYLHDRGTSYFGWTKPAESVSVADTQSLEV
ncbi:hypothetical protein [Cysteiniphilum sp. 6C5]|uniref:hypothetical protein n=1 Tax=unclassified Cysteiniphilum TaxID=2610889 RepID=UPI003F8762C1